MANCEGELTERKKNFIWFPKIPDHTVNKPNTKQIWYVAYKGQSLGQ